MRPPNRCLTNTSKGLAHGIVSLFNVLDPEVIVLGGGVSMAGEYLLDAVREAVRPLVFFKTLPYPSIQLAQLGADAGIIGAALLGARMTEDSFSKSKRGRVMCARVFV